MPWFNDNGKFTDVAMNGVASFSDKNPTAQPVSIFADDNGRTYGIPLGQEGYYTAQNPNLRMIPSASDQMPSGSGMGATLKNWGQGLVSGVGQQAEGLIGGTRGITGTGSIAAALDPVLKATAGGIGAATNYIAPQDELAAVQNLSVFNPRRIGTSVAQSAGPMGGAIALGALTGETGPGAIAAELAYWAAPSTNEFLNIMDSAGIKDQGVAKKNADEYGIANGVLMAAQKALTLGGTGKALAGILSEVGGNTKVGDIIHSALAMGGISAGQAALKNYFLDKAAGEYQQINPNYNTGLINSMKEGLGEAGLSGALVGGVMRAPFAAMSGKPTFRSAKEISPSTDAAAATQDQVAINQAPVPPATSSSPRMLSAPMEGDNFTQGKYAGQYDIQRNNLLSPQDRQPENIANQQQLSEMGPGMPAPQPQPAGGFVGQAAPEVLPAMRMQPRPEVLANGNVDTLAALSVVAPEEAALRNPELASLRLLTRQQLEPEAAKRGIPVLDTDTKANIVEKIDQNESGLKATQSEQDKQDAIGNTGNPIINLDAAANHLADNVRGVPGITPTQIDTLADHALTQGYGGFSKKQLLARMQELHPDMKDILSPEKPTEAGKAVPAESDQPKTQTQPEEPKNAVQEQSPDGKVPRDGIPRETPQGNVGPVDEGNKELQQAPGAQSGQPAHVPELQKDQSEGTAPHVQGPDLKLAKSSTTAQSPRKGSSYDSVLADAGVPEAARESIKSRLGMPDMHPASVSGRNLDAELKNYGLTRESFANTKEGIANETIGGEKESVDVRAQLRKSPFSKMIEVVPNNSKLPDHLKGGVKQATLQSEGKTVVAAVYDPRSGKSYIVASRLSKDPAKRAEQVQQLINHEVSTHAGLDALFKGNVLKKNSALLDLHSKMKDDSDWKDGLKQIAKDYPEYDQSTSYGRANAVEELLAHISESPKSWTQKAIEWLKSLLEKLGLHDFSDKAIRDILARSGKAAEESAKEARIRDEMIAGLRVIHENGEDFGHEQIHGGTSSLRNEPHYAIKRMEEEPSFGDRRVIDGRTYESSSGVWRQVSDEKGVKFAFPLRVDTATERNLDMGEGRLNVQPKRPLNVEPSPDMKRQLEVQSAAAAEAVLNPPKAKETPPTALSKREYRQREAALKLERERLEKDNKEKGIEATNFYNFSQKQLFAKLAKTQAYLGRVKASLDALLEKRQKAMDIHADRQSMITQINEVAKNVADINGERPEYGNLAWKAINKINATKDFNEMKGELYNFMSKAEDVSLRAARGATEKIISKTANSKSRLGNDFHDVINSLATHYQPGRVRADRASEADAQKSVQDKIAALAEKHPDLRTDAQNVAGANSTMLSKGFDDLNAREIDYLGRLFSKLHEVGREVYDQQEIERNVNLAMSKHAALTQNISERLETTQGRAAQSAIRKIGSGEFDIDKNGELTYKGVAGFVPDQEGNLTWNSKLGKEPPPGIARAAESSYRAFTNKIRPSEGEINRLQKLAGSWWHRFWSEGLKVSTLMELMDGKKGLDVLRGSWYNAFYRPMDLAETVFRNSYSKWQNDLAAIYKAHGVGDMLKWKREIIGHVGNYDVTRQLAMSVYAHSLNEHNLASLTSKYGNEMTEATAKRIVQLLKDTEPEATKIVDDVVAKLPSLYNEMRGVFERMGERAPERVAGVYMPMMKPKETTGRVVSSDIDMKGSTADMLLGSGFTKEREDLGKMVLNLDFFDAIDSHVKSVTRFNAYAEKFDQVKKLALDKEMRSAMAGRLGVEGLNQVESWLKDIARPGWESANSDMPSKIMRFMRQRAVASILAFRASTALVQTTQMFQAIPEIGQKNMIYGWNRILTDWASARAEVMEKSQAVKDRIHGGFDKDTEELVKSMNFASDAGKLLPSETWRKGVESFDKVQQKITNIGMIPIQFMDQITCAAVWHGAREKAYQEMTAKGMDPHTDGNEKLAVQYADHVVRTTQSSPRITDQSQWQRGGELQKTLMTLQSFFNSTYNLIRKNSSNTLAGKQSYGDYANQMFWLVAANGIATCALDTLLHGNPDQESLAKRMASSIGASAFVGTPGISMAVNSMLKGYNPRIISWQGLQKIGGAGLPTASPQEKQMKSFADGIFALSGLPKQALDSAFGAYDVSTGQAIDDQDAMRRVIAPQASTAFRYQALRKAQKEAAADGEEPIEDAELEAAYKTQAAQKRAMKQTPQ